MKILIVDDEVSILYLVELNLKIEGYEVIKAQTGAEAIDKMREEKPDLAILDIMLPDTDGYSLIKRLRSIDENLPVIMLTAKSDINDKLLGLQLGADDYMTKPFHSTELILRIKAISKRISKAEKVDSKNEINVGNIKILRDERKVFVAEKEVVVTYKEFDLLLLLAENKEKVFTREELLNKVWGYDFEGTTRAVDILIQRLRKKLDDSQELIQTIYGVGYKLEADNK